MTSGQDRSSEPPRSFRCPVCGHVDDVPAPVAAGDASLMACSHCETALQVERVPDDPTDVLPVRVAPAPGT